MVRLVMSGSEMGHQMFAVEMQSHPSGRPQSFLIQGPQRYHTVTIEIAAVLDRMHVHQDHRLLRPFLDQIIALRRAIPHQPTDPLIIYRQDQKPNLRGPVYPSGAVTVQLATTHLLESTPEVAVLPNTDDLTGMESLSVSLFQDVVRCLQAADTVEPLNIEMPAGLQAETHGNREILVTTTTIGPCDRRLARCALTTCVLAICDPYLLPTIRGIRGI
jgi:hypothetical protein